MSDDGQHSLIGRDAATERPLRLTIDGPTIVAVEPVEAADDWLAPGLWDIQTNGRLGVSFSDPSLTVEQVREVVLAQAATGTARLCPTLITAPLDDLRHGLRTIADACEADPEVRRRVVGIHLEGPFLSPLEGYRGAHPASAMMDPDWDVFTSLQEAAGGRIAIVTMAPERPGAIRFIERAAAEGIVVAIGHSAADPATIDAAVSAGARLSTHLGNGIAATLPRHPNPIWAQAADDRLTASLIADGHHLDDATLKVLARAKTAGRTVLVSDASPLAGLPAGRYGAWEVEASGRVVVAGTPYLAGANRPLIDGVDRLVGRVGFPLSEAIAAATTNPARLLGRPEPRLAPGMPADVIRFRFTEGRIELRETIVGGALAASTAAGTTAPARPRAAVARS